MSGSTVVTYHDCIKNGDHVKIVADVLTTRRGTSVLLIAHGPRCRSYPKEPLMDRIGVL